VTTSTIVATGPRALRYPRSVRAGFAMAAAGYKLGVTGGAGGADTQAAWGAWDAGVPFEVWFPNAFYRRKYKDSIPDELLARALRVRHVVDRTVHAGEDPLALWDRMKWWVDNFARNEAMAHLPARLAVVSVDSPRLLTAPGLKGGTAHCVRTAVRLGHTRCLWVHDAPEPSVEEVELVTPPPASLFDAPELSQRPR
jgi:hypothetical protein